MKGCQFNMFVSGVVHFYSEIKEIEDKETNSTFCNATIKFSKKKSGCIKLNEKRYNFILY